MPPRYRHIFTQLFQQRGKIALGIFGAVAGGLAAKTIYTSEKKTSPLLPTTPLVATTIYSIQKDKTGFNPGALKALPDIVDMKSKFTDTAKKFDGPVPEFAIVYYVIPDWRNGATFYDLDYQKASVSFLQALKQEINKNPELAGIKLLEFRAETNLTTEEEGYLCELEAKGSVADMMKTRILIDPSNAMRPILQMDSNTHIVSYQRLYELTLGRRGEQTDAFLGDVALNASFYDADYVSAHNKIVYVTVNSPFRKVLKEDYLAYCEKHQDDHLKEDTKLEKISKNSIYSKVFTGALYKLGLVLEREKPTKKVVYPVDLLHADTYRLTQVVAAAVNMSWRDNKGSSKDKLLGLLKFQPVIEIGDAKCDFSCFQMAVKKYTGLLREHGSGDKKISVEEEEKAHEEFVRLSNIANDHKMIRNYYEHIKNEYPQYLDLLAEEFPDTQRGNQLTQELFKCSVAEFKQQSQSIANSSNETKQPSPRL